MVNINSILEDGDILTSSARSGEKDSSFQHDIPQEGSDHDQDYQKDWKEDSNNDKGEEIQSTPFSLITDLLRQWLDMRTCPCPRGKLHHL